MRFTVAYILLATATSVSAQAVVGNAYGFATGVTGGGAGNAVAPSSAEELAEWLADDTERVILIDQEYDFTGTTASEPGCDRISCSSSNGGQLYLGDLSCGGSDNTAVNSVAYDVAGTEPLLVGSNKSIVGSGGKGVLKGKGLRLNKGSSNVIIQGIEFTDINPGVVWGGDALDFQGENDGVWVDHCKFSLVGRMFIVSHYTPSRLTISNNVFDGVTTTSASCNGNHYWTMMFYGDGDRVTLDRNHFHDVSGRAPKLGDGKGKGTFQVTNNYFSNMKGHAFDIYEGASAILEGNAFESVKEPITKQGASISTVFNAADEAAASACESSLGRACAINSVDSDSGDWPSLSDTGVLSAFSSLKEFLVEPVAASEVASLVGGGAGPANVGSGSSAPVAAEPAPVEETPVATSSAVTEPSLVEETPAATSAAVGETPEETEEVPENTEQGAVEKPEQNPEAPKQTPEKTPEQTPEEDTEIDAGEDTEEDIEDETEVCNDGATEDDEDLVEEDEGCSSSEANAEGPTPDASESNSSSKEVQQYGQCGGSSYSGPTKCVAGTSCVVTNPYYSQCISSASRRAARGLRVHI